MSRVSHIMPLHDLTPIPLEKLNIVQSFSGMSRETEMRRLVVCRHPRTAACTTGCVVSCAPCCAPCCAAVRKTSHGQPCTVSAMSLYCTELVGPSGQKDRETWTPHFQSASAGRKLAPRTFGENRGLRLPRPHELTPVGDFDDSLEV